MELLGLMTRVAILQVSRVDSGHLFNLFFLNSILQHRVDWELDFIIIFLFSFNGIIMVP
jgi:hypothetical protein